MAKSDIFQPTLPRGERRKVIGIRCLGFNFNPRSREGSDKTSLRNGKRHFDFNPRSREGSDIPNPSVTNHLG